MSHKKKTPVATKQQEFSFYDFVKAFAYFILPTLMRYSAI